MLNWAAQESLELKVHIFRNCIQSLSALTRTVRVELKLHPYYWLKWFNYNQVNQGVNMGYFGGIFGRC